MRRRPIARPHRAFERHQRQYFSIRPGLNCAGLTVGRRKTVMIPFTAEM
jgi:hypothetical protein